MSNVIDFLEKVGRDGQLRQRSRVELEQVLDDVSVSPELRAALLAGNQQRIEELLGCEVVCCMLIPGKEQEEGEEEREDEDVPVREDEPNSRRAQPIAMTSRG